METIICSNHLTLKEACGSKISTTLTLFIQELLEQLLITHQQVNIDLDSFQTKNLDVCAVNTPLNQDDIYYINVEDIASTGI